MKFLYQALAKPNAVLETLDAALEHMMNRSQNLGTDGLSRRQRCTYPTQNHWETEPTAGEIIRPANAHCLPYTRI